MLRFLPLFAFLLLAAHQLVFWYSNFTVQFMFRFYFCRVEFKYAKSLHNSLFVLNLLKDLLKVFVFVLEQMFVEIKPDLLICFQLRTPRGDYLVHHVERVPVALIVSDVKLLQLKVGLVLVVVIVPIYENCATDLVRGAHEEEASFVFLWVRVQY